MGVGWQKISAVQHSLDADQGAGNCQGVSWLRIAIEVTRNNALLAGCNVLLNLF